MKEGRTRLKQCTVRHNTSWHVRSYNLFVIAFPSACGQLFALTVCHICILKWRARNHSGYVDRDGSVNSND